MIVFHDATGQVQAIYSHGTESTIWTDRGFQMATVPPNLEKRVGQLARGGRVTVQNGVVSRVISSPDPDPPTPKPRFTPATQALRDKLSDNSITDAEIRDLLRLERGI